VKIAIEMDKYNTIQYQTKSKQLTTCDVLKLCFAYISLKFEPINCNLSCDVKSQHLAIDLHKHQSMNVNFQSL